MKIKRLVVAGVVASTLAGGAFAFANSLDVTSQTLASGTASVDSACPAVAVNWTTSYVAATPAVPDDTEVEGDQSVAATPNHYELTLIKLDGDTGCTTQSYKVTVADADGASIHEYTGNLVAGNFDIDASAENIDAADVGNVTAVITGATATP